MVSFSLNIFSGLIPFSCAFIELYFLYSSIWSYSRIYWVYGFLLAVLSLLSIVVICVSITSTYILLNSEDHRWAWNSMLSCGLGTGGWILLYSWWFYWKMSELEGLL